MLKTVIAGLTLIASAGLCLAQEMIDHHGHDQTTQDQHAKFHGFYLGLRQPKSGISCCNNQDCRPAFHRVTPTGIEVEINGVWRSMPQGTVIETETPDQGAHWCGIGENSGAPTTYCVIIPRGNT